MTSPAVMDPAPVESAAAPAVATTLLVLGLGNDILTDDAIGLHVARAVGRRCGGRPGVTVTETTEMGLALLDFMAGQDAMILVDSIQTGKAPPGTLHVFDGSEVKSLPGGSPHFLGVGETLALGRALGLRMPERVLVFAVEVQDPITLGVSMTPALRAALPSLGDRVTAAVFELTSAV
jgi:hydrogenase maturation protease